MVWIDHVRALDMIALAISRPEPVMSRELRTIRLVGFPSCVFWPVELAGSDLSGRSHEMIFVLQSCA